MVEQRKKKQYLTEVSWVRLTTVIYSASLLHGLWSRAREGTADMHAGDIWS